MVVDQLPDADADQLFHALADTTRRDILRRSVDGHMSVSQLAELYPTSFAAIQKHVTVLERAGLVVKQAKGRERLVRARPEAVERARRALDEIEEAWRGRIDRMKQVLDEDLDRDRGNDNDRSPR